jgi:hypothetical protein
MIGERIMRRNLVLLIAIACVSCGGGQPAQSAFAGRWVGRLISMDDGTVVASCNWNLVPGEGSSSSVRGTWSCAQPSDTVMPRIGDGGYLIGEYGESDGWCIAEIAFAAAVGSEPFKMDVYAVFEDDGALRGQVNVSGIAYDNLYVDFERR